MKKQYKYILSISGGVDSMVMLEMIYKKYKKFENIKVNDCLVITFDHGTRGGQSRKDAGFVYQRSLAMGFDCQVIRLNISRISKLRKTGFEDTARTMRYENLEYIRQKYGAEYIMTAHHEDDLLETILMKIIRGTFMKGFIGMEEFSGDLWRPLLDMKKQDVRDYALKYDVKWVEDITNIDNKYFRNRIRNILLPSLEQAIPSFRKQLLHIRKLVMMISISMHIYCDELLEDLHGDGLDLYNWISLKPVQKSWLISSLVSESTYSEINLQESKLKDLIKRIDVLKPGKKVLLAHREYPIIRRKNKLFFGKYA